MTTAPPEPLLSEEDVLHSTELFMIACCLFWEGRSEGPVGMSRIYDVISNRAADPGARWPNSMLQVVMQAKQFSCFNHDDKQPFPNPKLVGDWLMWIEANRIARRGVVGHPSINHYHTRAVRPQWATGKTPVLIQGEHHFYSF